MSKYASIKKILMVHFLTTTLGCGVDDNKNTSNKSKTSNVVAAPTCDSSTEAPLTTDNRLIPAAELTMTMNGNKINMCEAYDLAGSDIAVFHFIDSKCYNCQKTADALALEFKDGYAHILIFTKASIQKNEVDREFIRNQIAPDAQTAFDHSGIMDSFFRNSERPMVVFMNRSAIGFFMESPLSNLEELKSKAATFK
jgi:hypothetical protein